MGRPTRVFLVCPGLGHVSRGFESFTRECFDALRGDPRLDLYLYKGAGPAADHDRTVWCLERDRAAARFVAGLVGRDSYFVEQATFALALVPRLMRWRPDVVMFSDGAVGNQLWRWRRLTRGRYKLLLSNGGPLGPPAHPRFDHVHQVSAACYEEAVQAGRPAGTQTLLPYGFRVPDGFVPSSPDERAALRQRLGLPAGRPVVLAVGAINRAHKRTDYLIRELAALPTPRPFLALLGQFEADTPSILAEAREQLGMDGFVGRTVPAAEVEDYYRAADVFTLGSLSEGFGRVLVEAALQGLRCLAHDGPIQRQVLGSDGRFADFSRPGNLAGLMKATLVEVDDDARRLARYQIMAERFGWDRLAPRYIDMIEQTRHAGTGKMEKNS